MYSRHTTTAYNCWYIHFNVAVVSAPSWVQYVWFPDLDLIIVVRLDTRHPTAHSYSQYIYTSARDLKPRRGQRIWGSAVDPLQMRLSLTWVLHTLEITATLLIVKWKLPPHKQNYNKIPTSKCYSPGYEDLWLSKSVWNRFAAHLGNLKILILSEFALNSVHVVFSKKSVLYAGLNGTSVCFKVLSVIVTVQFDPQHQPQLMNFNVFSWIRIFCLGYPLKNKHSVALVALGTPNNQQHKTDTHTSVYMFYFNLSQGPETKSYVCQRLLFLWIDIYCEEWTLGLQTPSMLILNVVVT